MKIIGHPWIESGIESERFAKVDSIEKIATTPAGTVLLIDDLAASIDLLHYCQREGLPFALRSGDIKTALFAHALNARYILATKEQAPEIQKLAQHYLFDTQILVEISDEEEIEFFARMGIDGVLFASAIT